MLLLRAGRTVRVFAAFAPFIVAALVYVGFAIRTDPLLQGDQPYYALDAYSLARDGDRDLSDDYRDLETVRRVWRQSTFPPHAYRYRPDGPYVSFHAAGLPVLLVPAALLSDSVVAMRVELALIAALGAWLLFDSLRRLVPRRPLLRWSVWGGVALGLPVLGYAIQLFPGVPAAVLVLAAVRILLLRRARVGAALCAASCAALLPWLHVRFWIIAAALALAIALRILGGPRRGAARLRALGAIALPFVVSASLMAVAHQAWYGSPHPLAAQRTPVQQVLPDDSGARGTRDPGGRPSRAPMFELADALSLAPERLYRGLGRSLFSARSGWLPFAPIAFIGVAAAIALAVRGHRWVAFGGFAALAYLVQVAATGTLPGYAIPGRFELVLAPFVALPLVLAAQHLRWLRIAIVPVAVLGIVVAINARMHVGALYPPPDERAKPKLAAGEWLLAPWPTVTREQPPPPRSVLFRPADLRVAGAAHATEDEVTAPAGDGSHVFTAVSDALTGDQVVAVALGRSGPAAAERRAGELILRIAGETVTRRTVTVGELPADSRLRGILLNARTHEGQRLAVSLRSTGAAALRVGGVQVRGATLADTGLGQTGTRLPDAGPVAAWTAGLLALAAAIALGLPRRSRATGMRSSRGLARRLEPSRGA